MTTKMTLFANQTSESTECIKLINIAIKLQEEGKARFETSENEFGEDMIGIKLENSNSYFWYVLRWEDDYVCFQHRYSQATGKIIRAFRTGWKFLRKIRFHKF
tara:strand:- start:53 stop:361 length:309 start_codon:yes stop_codon:yes gene_type:complete